jgi:hypothetical protein
VNKFRLRPQPPALLLVSILLSLLGTSFAIACDEVKDPGCTAREKAKNEAPKAKEEPKKEVSIHIGHEANKPDGLYAGPNTYGISATYGIFSATTTRLHEPGTPALHSFLDEAQLTVTLPEKQVFTVPIVFDGTVWKNRTMDMYTNVIGVEASYENKIGEIKDAKYGIGLGVYGGTATRDSETGRFLGYKVSGSASYKAVELALSYMNGAIRTQGDHGHLGTGRYRKTAAEVTTNINIANKLPLGITTAVEKRYFNFGNGGSESDPVDTYIFTIGVEANVTDLFHFARKKKMTAAPGL